MSRKVASSIIVRQDVCVFCALRPAFGVATRRTRTGAGLRNYHSSTSASSPASAVAARSQEDDEDEPPMLRQNSNLSRSFPSRRRQEQNQTPVNVRFEPVASAKSQENSPHLRDGYPLSESNTSNRGIFPNLSRSRNSNQDSRHMRNTHETMNSLQGDINGTQSQRNDQGLGRYGNQQQRRRGMPNNRNDFAEQRPTWTRRFIPQADFSPDSADRDNRGYENNRTDGISRGGGSWRNDGYNTAQQNEIPQGQNQTFRKLKLGDSPAGIDNTSKGRKSYKETPPLEGKTTAEFAIGDSEAMNTAEAPAGTLFDDVEEPVGFHHRRGHNVDRRKSRLARFEDETEETPVVSQPLGSSRTSPDFAGRSNTRGTRFDYDLAEAEEALYGDRSRKKKKGKTQKAQQVEPVTPSVKIAEFMSVGQLAKSLNVQLDLFLAKLEEEGFEGARYDHILDASTSSMFAEVYGFEPIVASESRSVDLFPRPPPVDTSDLPPRPPIVTIMGHVDHGKTTILDFLRKSSVVASEHGGITQHIGAFSVTMPGTNRQITFLDTPGHAAFLEMRRRGANVTDIVVLVVAADDSVKPQTIEAIKHAIEAKVQIIVAINKVDKEDANVERVKQDLTRHEIVVEDYGGDFQAIPVSGKTGLGMADLEEAIITLADVHDYRAEKDGHAEGTIIESKVTAAGRVATVLVRRGTLRPGDFIVAGPTWARVRTLRDDTGQVVTEAGPGTPVQVDGWRGEDPTAGLEVLQAESESQAKEVVEYRIDQRDNARTAEDMTAINEARSDEADARAKTLAWESEQAWASKSFGRRPRENAGWVESGDTSGPRQVHFIVKADVAGSVEAVVAAVSAIGNNEIVANVIHSGTGQLAESDIRMLATTGETGYAISFNQPIEGAIYRLAETAGLQILDHNIIYKVTDTVKEKLADHLPPIVTQKVLGEAEIGQIFEVTIKKTKVKIAGCKVTNGTISRANKVRVQRGGEVVYTGSLHSLKNVKKDVTEMRKGTECGMGFEDWDDFMEGDQIQCYEEHEEKRTLY